MNKHALSLECVTPIKEHHTSCGQLRRLRFRLTNSERRSEVVTLLGRCDQGVAVTVHPSTLQLGGCSHVEVQLTFRSGRMRRNLVVTLECVLGGRGSDQLAHEVATTCSVWISVHEKGMLIQEREAEVTSSVAEDSSSAKHSYKESLGPCTESVGTVVTKVLSSDPHFIHVRFKAKLKEGREQEFCLARVKFDTAGSDDEMRAKREATLSRVSQLVLGHHEPLQLRLVPGTGTPLLAHLHLGGAQQPGNTAAALGDLATLLLNEKLMVKDDGATYSRGGYTAMAHGNVFHWHVLMLLLLRARRDARKFRLAVEYQPAGKFDDVFFSYEDESGEWNNVYMQLKHNASGSGKIKLSDLIKINPKDKTVKLCLKTFANSYKNISSNKGKNISMLFTNQGIEFEEINNSNIDQFQLQKDKFHEIEILYPDIFNNKCLKFNKKSIDKLTEILSVDDASDNKSNEYIKKFLYEFYFAVNQMNAKELKQVVKEELLSECQGRTDVMENKYSRFMDWIQKWMEKAHGDFINNNKLDNFFQEINLQVQGNVNMIPRQVTTSFHGREKEQALSSEVFTSTTKGKELIDIVICGQPGVGKTELALQIIKNNKNKFDHIIWIDAEDKNILKSEFYKIGKRLSIVTNKFTITEDDNLKLTIEKIYTMFSKYKTLFIFDSVKDNLDIRDFLPSTCINNKNIFIVATSNNRSLPCNNLIPLECFSVWESVYFLDKELDLIDNTDAARLAISLGNHPMALQLAISYIKHERKLPGKQNYSISDFINDKNIDKLILEDTTDNNEYINNKCFAIMWNISIKSVSENKQYGKLAIKILEMLSYMESEYIPLSIFKKLNDNYKESILLLKEYSLIKYFNEQASIHKLLQTVIRNNYKLNEKLILSELISLFEIKTINRKTEFINDQIVPHAMKVWVYVSQYEDLIKEFQNIPVAIAYTNLVDENSILFIEEHITKLESVLSWDSKIFLRFYMRYIELVWKCELYSKAIEMCEIFTKNTPEFVNISIVNIDIIRINASSLYKLERLEESWSIYQKLYLYELSTFGFDSKETLDTLKIMWKITLKLYYKNNDEIFQKYLCLFEMRIMDSRSNIDITSRILNDIGYVINFEELSDTLKLKLLNLMYTVLVVTVEETHALTLFVLLAKSKQLCHLEREEEAWLIYVRVCQLLGQDSGPHFNELKGFLVSLYADLGSSLDMSLGLVRLVTLAVSGISADCSLFKSSLKSRLALRAVTSQREAENASLYPEAALPPNGDLYVACKVMDDVIHIPVRTTEIAQRSSSAVAPEPSTHRTRVKSSTESTSHNRESWESDFDEIIDFDAFTQHSSVVELLEGDSIAKLSYSVRSQLKNIKTLKRSKKHEEIISKCDKILSKITPQLMNHRDILWLLQTKAESLHLLQNLDEAGDIWYDLYDRCNTIFGIDDQYTIYSLTGMFKTAIILHENGNKKLFDLWLDLIQNRITDHNLNHKKTLDIIQETASYLIQAGKESVYLHLSDLMHKTLISTVGPNDALTLCNLLTKAECFWDIHREREAWTIYNQVCTIRGGGKFVAKTANKSNITMLRMDLRPH